MYVINSVCGRMACACVCVSFGFLLYSSNCSQCGMKDPSWSELRCFVQFLDLQLLSCEVFCNEALVGEIMEEFKTFLVKFMIRMSKVCLYSH